MPLCAFMFDRVLTIIVLCVVSVCRVSVHVYLGAGEGEDARDMHIHPGHLTKGPPRGAPLFCLCFAVACDTVCEMLLPSLFVIAVVCLTPPARVWARPPSTACTSMARHSSEPGWLHRRPAHTHRHPAQPAHRAALARGRPATRPPSPSHRDHRAPQRARQPVRHFGAPACVV